MRFPQDVKFDPEPVERLLTQNRCRGGAVMIEFAGVRLQIDEGVFAPDLTRTSSLMLACLPSLHVDWRVLDVFSGSGVFAIVAASRGCRTVAVDISPLATRCATGNGRLNGVSHLLDVRLGDGLAVLRPDELFDLVVACPPLLPGCPSDFLEMSVLDPGLGATFRFLDALPQHLTPAGFALILLSDVFERIGHDVLQSCAERKITAETVGTLNAGYETYTVYRLRRAVDLSKHTVR